MAVRQGAAKIGIVPSPVPAYACRYRAHIVGEVTVEVNHRLLALPGVQTSAIRRVISHWQVGPASNLSS